jgi:hypothetical protein
VLISMYVTSVSMPLIFTPMTNPVLEAVLVVGDAHGGVGRVAQGADLARPVGAVGAARLGPAEVRGEGGHRSPIRSRTG